MYIQTHISVSTYAGDANVPETFNEDLEHKLDVSRDEPEISKPSKVCVEGR